MEIFKQEGQLLELGSNKPFLLDNADSIWFIEKGAVNVFWVPVREHEVVGSHNHLFKAAEGNLLFGLAPHEKKGLSLLAVGVSGTQLRKLSRGRLQQVLQQDSYGATFSRLAQTWVTELSEGLFHRLILPKEIHSLEEKTEVDLESGETGVTKLKTIWCQQQSGILHFFGNPNFAHPASQTCFPLTQHLWFQTAEKSKLTLLSAEDVFKNDPRWQSLDLFHEFIFQQIKEEQKEELEHEKQRFKQKEVTDQQAVDHAFLNLASILEQRRAASQMPDTSLPQLLNAAKLVGDFLGIDVLEHPDLKRHGYGKDALQKIARASHFRIRQVMLKGEWWKEDNGPLYATLEKENQPVALLPTSAKSYELVNPGDGSRLPVTDAVSESLTGVSFSFYRPFPLTKMGLKQVLSFALRGLRKDLFYIVLLGIGIGLLGLITPLATGKIFNSLIPGAERMQLLQLSIALVIASFSVAAFSISRNIVIQRVNGKMDATVQASIWDRLLDLPAPFFRDYSAGDLAQRALGINMITQTLSITVVSAILGGIFGLFNIALLFYYSVKLALVAVALVILSLIVFYFATRAQLKYQKPIATLQGKISGMVLQFISNGIAKLRVAAAEDRAFSKWAEPFTQQKQFSYKARVVMNWITVFQTIYPLFCTLILFIFMAHWSFQTSGASATGAAQIPTGSFLAFNSAFGSFMAAALMMGTTIISIIVIVPYYQRIKPIFETLPEVDDAKADPGDLAGNIEVDKINFRYRKDGPLVLENVSFEAKEGEFIALVGPSGSGKSTLMRLLLGFEKPESGSIFFDGQDLEGLDLHSVRRQTGVVLQNGKLLQGDIFTNIIGSSPLTMHDAWDAVRMAGMEEDIKDMPMQLYTVVSEGGGSLSGGQKQRLMIARAIVHKPRILIFDEATSALDNRTQQIVSKSLESLKATRIVIAHRLSTIQHADRIYVLVNGKVVQVGNFEELMKQPGHFQELIKRQMA